MLQITILFLAIAILVWGGFASFIKGYMEHMKPNLEELERHRRKEFHQQVVAEATANLKKEQRAQESELAFEARVAREVSARMRAMTPMQHQPAAAPQPKPKGPWQQAQATRQQPSPPLAYDYAENKRNVQLQDDLPLSSHTGYEQDEEITAQHSERPAVYNRDSDFPTPGAM